MIYISFCVLFNRMNEYIINNPSFLCQKFRSIFTKKMLKTKKILSVLRCGDTCFVGMFWSRRRHVRGIVQLLLLLLLLVIRRRPRRRSVAPEGVMASRERRSRAALLEGRRRSWGGRARVLCGISARTHCGNPSSNCWKFFLQICFYQKLVLQIFGSGYYVVIHHNVGQLTNKII